MASTEELIVLIGGVYDYVKENRIRAVMDPFGWGSISKVVIKPMLGDSKANDVWIHFSSWNNTEKSIQVRQMLDAGEKVNVVWSHRQWVWAISKHQPSVQQHVPHFDLAIDNDG